jgi:hypothetical protein
MPAVNISQPAPTRSFSRFSFRPVSLLVATRSLIFRRHARTWGRSATSIIFPAAVLVFARRFLFAHIVIHLLVLNTLSFAEKFRAGL